jgi:hypothetical protein
MNELNDSGDEQECAEYRHGGEGAHDGNGNGDGAGDDLDDAQY